MNDLPLIALLGDLAHGIKAANPAVDFTSLETAITSLQALAPPAPPVA